MKFNCASSFVSGTSALKFDSASSYDNIIEFPQRGVRACESLRPATQDSPDAYKPLTNFEIALAFAAGIIISFGTLFSML